LGYYSGYKINVTKTEALPMNNLVAPQMKSAFSFRWPREGIRYLGINIPPDHSLYQSNYIKLIDTIKQDLYRWTTLPLTLISRVEAVRMNVIPRLLFLFQTLPISPPKSFLILWIV
jgi:hypothetical protein